MPLRHHQCGAFLAALVRCVDNPDEQRVCAVALAAAWGDGLGACAPDRTAMRRLVAAAQRGLQAVLSTSRVASLPRKATVGPWWLEVGPGEHFRVLPHGSIDGLPTDTPLGRMRADAALLGKKTDGGPCLAKGHEPAPIVNVVAALTVADALARHAHYQDAVEHLNEVADGLGLSAEGAAVFELRKVRWLRRAGQRAKARAVLVVAEALTRQAHRQARGALAPECALQSARLSYDVDPTKNVHTINFERLSQQIDQAGSPKLLWELANLQALASRRKLQALMLRAVPAQPSTLQCAAQQAQDCFGTALYWLAVADDPYHLQAVLVNYAYHLQWPTQQKKIALAQSAADVATAVEAWRLSQALIEKFELPEDSAWDFIMLADLWLGHSGARKLMQTDWRLWPNQRSPAKAAFYERAVALAGQTGDARQQALALDRCAAFSKESGDWQRAAEALKERDALLAADTALATQVAKEILWAGGGQVWG
jgi:hypothetical protein